MDRYKEIDNKIQQGYTLILENDYPGGCDKWLEAWSDIQGLFTEGVAKDIYELDRKYNWSQFISNYAQDMEMELHNAGIKNISYHRKRAEFCQELLQRCGTDELIISNTRRGMAEGYFRSGEIETGDRLFADWLREDPDWGWGYVGWSDCYWHNLKDKQYEKAEEILLVGFARSETRDKVAIADRLSNLYKEWGNPDRAKEFKKVFSELQQNIDANNAYYKSPPTKSEKIGRNDLCPCGSGKKYKKCCGV